MTTATATDADLMHRFWHDDLADADPEIAQAVQDELKRQRNKIELIASENIASRAVLEAAGTPRPSRTHTSSPPPRTRACAARARA